MGASLFWYRNVIFVVSRWPKSPFWYRDLFWGIEILHSAVWHWDRLPPGINPCALFGASTSCTLETNQISIPKRRSKNLDTKKKTSRRQLKESPDFIWLPSALIACGDADDRPWCDRRPGWCNRPGDWGLWSSHACCCLWLSLYYRLQGSRNIQPFQPFFPTLRASLSLSLSIYLSIYLYLYLYLYLYIYKYISIHIYIYIYISLSFSFSFSLSLYIYIYIYRSIYIHTYYTHIFIYLHSFLERCLDERTKIARRPPTLNYSGQDSLRVTNRNVKGFWALWTSGKEGFYKEYVWNS